ncbi:unnamed protein product [Rotaria sp. Silwood1]|nr:unnamed protein product [Rotaria sp. Silwood1]
MVEEYSRYIKQSIKFDNDDSKYLCECSHSQSFGKHCEYFLPVGTTFDETIQWELEMKSTYPWRIQMYSDILCYTTLICDYGLLCLDWRDICDGKQQCMSGYDEENCDKLEFNECDDDEYRCMNGMCIPDESFLDGEYDCMDFTDEKQLFDDKNCTYQAANLQCDDRLCLPNRWSCGDGQCIKQRFDFQNTKLVGTDCTSRRSEYYICELYGRYKRWTLPNGKCYPSSRYEESNTKNRTMVQECIYLVKCALSQGAETKCPCNGTSCIDALNKACPPVNIQYPNGSIIAPYIRHFYNATRNWKQKLSDLMVFNATIKCRGYMIYQYTTILPYLYGFDLRDFEVFLCSNSSISSIIPMNGYDKYCYNDSITFNNHSYNFIDVCKYSMECISAYRIGDGIVNCQDKMDENQSEINISNICQNVKRHRFRCSSEEPSCLYVINLGDFDSNCNNNYDESWMGTDMMLSKVDCNSQSKDGCEFIRQYINMSWNSNTNNNNNNNNNNFTLQLSSARIPFRAYCDTFWDLYSKDDENVTTCQTWWICLEEQWQCRTGQCIDKKWVLDGEWDCIDASDEENIFAFDTNLSDHNTKVFKNFSVLQDKFRHLYGIQAFSTICNLSREYPCLRVNMSDDLYTMSHDRLCISLEQIGDGYLDCLGGVDERNFQEHCDRPGMLGRDFLCASSKTWIAQSSACSAECPDTHEASIACTIYGYNNDRPKVKDYRCINHTHKIQARCDGKNDCLFGEDEYMCDRRNLSDAKPSNTLYRKQKEIYVRNADQNPHLPQFPLDVNNTKFNDIYISTNDSITTSTPSSEVTSSLISYWCNRGIGIQIYNGSIVCFCPPQYYGDRCQYYSDRVTVYLHLNLSPSIYTESIGSEIVIKLLVLFLYKNQVLTTDEFHLQPVVEISSYRKKIGYFLYSRSFKLLEEKRKRHFNRSNIIHEHHYSIRIEAYELNVFKTPVFIAIWQYPIYFDYLPVFRLAKVLRLIKSTEIDGKNPCLKNPCNQYQQCHQLLNQKSAYICVCKNNFRGTDCSIIDHMCKNNHCSGNALCKPNYRSLISGNILPYCICPATHFGHRCELVHDSCISNPCQNNGTCFPTLKPNEFSCLCTDHYHGKQCDMKTKAISLKINETIKHDAVVIQYFDINFSSLKLILVHQHPYCNIPHVLEYRYTKTIAPAIVLAKLYSNIQTEIYLISLHMHVRSIDGVTQISERNRCIHVRKLLETSEGML